MSHVFLQLLSYFFAHLQQNVSKELPIVTASASYNLPGGLLLHCPTDGHLQGHQWLLMYSSVQSQITVCPCGSQHLTDDLETLSHP